MAYRRVSNQLADCLKTCVGVRYLVPAETRSEARQAESPSIRGQQKNGVPSRTRLDHFCQGWRPRWLNTRTPLTTTPT